MLVIFKFFFFEMEFFVLYGERAHMFHVEHILKLPAASRGELQNVSFFRVLYGEPENKRRFAQDFKSSIRSLDPAESSGQGARVAFSKRGFFKSYNACDPIAKRQLYLKNLGFFHTFKFGGLG